MGTSKKFEFKAKIYKTGINWCVDVPHEITSQFTAKKGYIKIRGSINNFEFTKTLIPVKEARYRLFVNSKMIKGGKTAVGEVATFRIEQDKSNVIKEYAMPDVLLSALKKGNLMQHFYRLTPSRKKDILKYLSYIKTDETLSRNIDKLISQLKENKKDVRIP